MEPISLIVSALAAGAVAAAQETAGSVVKDTYNGLKELIKRKFGGKPEAEVALAKHEAEATDPRKEGKPKVWEGPLKEALSETGADKDEEVARLAAELLEHVREGVAAGKYNISAEKIGVVGDHTVVHGDIFGGGSDSPGKK